MTAGNAKIYFVKGSLAGSGAIKVMNADGSGETTLVSGSEVVEPDALEVDVAGGKIYWTEMGPGGAADKSVAADDGKIMRSDLDGRNIETIVPEGITTTPKQLALDVAGGKVYWSDRGDVGDQNINPKIMRSNLDGSAVETLISADLTSPVGMILDVPGDKLYFSDRYANNIKRANLDGTDVEVVVKDTQYPVDLLIDFDTRTLYWTAREVGGVYRVNIDEINADGASLSPIVTGLSNPIGITMDRTKRKLYYTECFLSDQSGAIWESDMDGSNTRKIATTSLPLGVYFVTVRHGR